MNRQILLGKTTDGQPIHLDVDKLQTTRLLIGANSGGGKSYLVRRLCEQLCSLMPVMIFDWEGEFVSLREKFDFVLVGKGGEVPADIRTAKLLMHKLLELRASVIFDLSELALPDRHQYVKALAEAAIESPKTLWRETAFIFDESHELVPENGKGSSVAKAAVLGFPTKGRKRHFITIFATQRMHKLAMDARAEFLNRMLGQTFEPDDLDVAAKTLGIASSERKAFNHTMRTMEPGMFYSFGRAIALETVLVKVAGVQTSNEVMTSATGGYKTPPAPAKIKKLLPSLADLPQEAARQLATEAELRAEVVRLQAELARRPSPQTEIKEVSLLRPEHVDSLKHVLDCADMFKTANAQMTQWMKSTEADIRKLAEAVDPEILVLRKNQAMGKSTEHLSRYLQTFQVGGQPTKVSVRKVDATVPFPGTDVPTGDLELSGGQSRILNALAWYESIGVMNPSLSQLAVAAHVAIPSGHFNNLAGPLSTQGLITRGNGCIALTSAGRAVAVVPDRIGSLAEYHDMLRTRVRNTKNAGGKTVEMLDVMINRNNASITNESMAADVGMAYPSGHFNNMIGPLSTLGLITRANGLIQPTEILFPKGLQ